MPDRPYTDDDLRAEAARQHREATQASDFPGLVDQMEGHRILSRDGLQWDELEEPDFREAQRGIDRLLESAVDVSAWAVAMGADGLEPSTEHEINIDAGGGPIARIHFAYKPDMPDEIRTALVEGLEQALDDADASLDEPDPDEQGDSDSDVFALISGIAGRLRDATDSGEYHAVGLIYDLANGRTTIADAREKLAEITFRHV